MIIIMEIINIDYIPVLKFLEKSIIKNNLSKRININFIDWNSDVPFAKEKIFPKKY